MAARRDAHLDVRPGRLVDLRGTADPADTVGRLVTRAERARVDQLVQMERGQLTGDPYGGRRFIPGYRRRAARMNSYIPCRKSSSSAAIALIA